MANVKLTLKNATDTVRLTMEPDDRILVQDLLISLCDRLELPNPGSRDFIGHLFQCTPGEVTLYDPHRGIFDSEKTVKENGIEPGDLLRYFCDIPASVSLSSIDLSEDRILSEVGLCIVVEWQNKYYPVIVPAKTTPQGHVEGSLLSYTVFRQIADIEGQAVFSSWLREWRYYNTRSHLWIDPYDTVTPLSDHFKHGDHVKVLPPEAILPVDDLADEISIIDDIVMIDDDQITPSADQDMLDQINLESGELDQSADWKTDSKSSTEINRTTLELVQGDITQQATDVIVNAANSSLAGGGGVDGAIHQAAGLQLVMASRALAPCLPGEAVITPGFRLPAKWVIHTVGPSYEGGMKGEAEVLASAYRNSLRLAINSRFSSIAFPSISTGVYSYPIENAAKVALKTAIDVLRTQNQLRLVRFVLFSDSDYEIYQQALGKVET